MVIDAREADHNAPRDVEFVFVCHNLILMVKICLVFTNTNSNAMVAQRRPIARWKVCAATRARPDVIAVRVFARTVAGLVAAAGIVFACHKTKPANNTLRVAGGFMRRYSRRRRFGTDT